MTRILTITYEKSNKDIPVMYVEESGLLSIKSSKMFTFRGKKAERLYKELTGQTESEEVSKWYTLRSALMEREENQQQSFT